MCIRCIVICTSPVTNGRKHIEFTRGCNKKVDVRNNPPPNAPANPNPRTRQGYRKGQDYNYQEKWGNPSSKQQEDYNYKEIQQAGQD